MFLHWLDAIGAKARLLVELSIADFPPSTIPAVALERAGAPISHFPSKAPVSPASSSLCAFSSRPLRNPRQHLNCFETRL
jgi:hypothetical protein